MYFHKEIKTSVGSEAYLLWCKVNNGTGFHSHHTPDRNKHLSKEKKWIPTVSLCSTEWSNL